jgi:hypothetical protein
MLNLCGIVAAILKMAFFKPVISARIEINGHQWRVKF